MVSVHGKEAYRVFSDPRFMDFDKDFLSDSTEYSTQTDPNLSDTDRDELSDNVDPFPSTLPCVDPAYLALTAWWDGSGAKSQADGKIVATSNDLPETLKENWRAMVKGINDPNEKVLKFNLDNTKNQYLAVTDTNATHPSIHSNREFTISAWLYWAGNVTDQVPDTIMMKTPLGSGTNILNTLFSRYPTYSLTILKEGTLQFSISRWVHEKIKQCSGGSCWDDNAVKDEDSFERNDLVTVNPIPKSRWIHVAASFGPEVMRIYIDGEKIVEKSTYAYWVNGSTWGGRSHERTTSFLISNDAPLMIGLDKVVSPSGHYRGLMDDIQFFTRVLQPEEVRQLYNLGVCQPQP